MSVSAADMVAKPRLYENDIIKRARKTIEKILGLALARLTITPRGRKKLAALYIPGLQITANPIIPLCVIIAWFC